MRPHVLVIAVAVTLLMACSRKAAEHATATPVAGAKSGGSLEITDDQITSFLAWKREYLDLARKHSAELQEVTDRLGAKYSPAETNKVSADPEFLGTLERQRAEMQQEMNRNPLSNEQMLAMNSVMDGLVPRRDETRLSKARRRYGEAFVDRVLARESELTAGFPRLQ